MSCWFSFQLPELSSRNFPYVTLVLQLISAHLTLIMGMVSSISHQRTRPSILWDLFTAMTICGKILNHLIMLFEEIECIWFSALQELSPNPLFAWFLFMRFPFMVNLFFAWLQGMLIWKHASLDYLRMDMEQIFLHGLDACKIILTGSKVYAWMPIYLGKSSSRQNINTGKR